MASLQLTAASAGLSQYQLYNLFPQPFVVTSMANVYKTRLTIQANDLAIITVKGVVKYPSLRFMNDLSIS